MSDNRFNDCETPERVLLSYRIRVSEMIRRGVEPDPLDAHALARIAELTPRTVDEAGREGTAAEPETDVACAPHGDLCICLDCRPPTTPAPVPPAPVVELTALQLESLAGIVRAHERTAIDLGPMAFSLQSVPMVVEDMPERDGVKLDVSVLRIGGGDE